MTSVNCMKTDSKIILRKLAKFRTQIDRLYANGPWGENGSSSHNNEGTLTKTLFGHPKAPTDSRNSNRHRIKSKLFLLCGDRVLFIGNLCEALSWSWDVDRVERWVWLHLTSALFYSGAICLFICLPFSANLHQPDGIECGTTSTWRILCACVYVHC